MSETNAKQLITDWDVSFSSATAITNGYEYVLDTIERLGWLTAATQQLGVANTAAYTMPAGAVRLFHLFYDDRELFRETRQTLRTNGERWRDVTGQPVGFIEDQETDNTFRLFPIPTIAGDALNYPNAEPFGRDFPRYNITTLASHRDNPPTWLDVNVALMTMIYARELESANQDLPMAESLKALNGLLMGILANA